MAVRTYIRKSSDGAFQKGAPYIEMSLTPGGYKLADEFGTFGPVRDPHALGFVIFAFGQGLIYDPEDAALCDAAADVLAWAASLSRIEQGDLRAIPAEFSSAEIARWAQDAERVCQSEPTGKEVSERIHWLLDPIAYQIQVRREAMSVAEDWLRESFRTAESFADDMRSLEAQGGPSNSVVVSAYLSGYHLLRGASRLYSVPTSEEKRTRILSANDSPEDVRLGYVELGLDKYQMRFGERLAAWEYALRYKPEFLQFVPDREEVRTWQCSVRTAYLAHFAEVLGLQQTLAQ